MRFRVIPSDDDKTLSIEFQGDKVFALDTGTMEGLTALIRGSPEAIVVLSSRSNVFCAGLDLVQMVEQQSGERQLNALVELFKALVEHPSPTVCLVAGPALAGGVGLALSADVVVMTCDAYFSLPQEAQYRPLAELLFPIVEARRRVTRSEFNGWFGKRISAQTLLAKGYVDAVTHRSIPKAEVGQAMRDAAASALTRLKSAGTLRRAKARPAPSEADVSRCLADAILASKTAGLQFANKARLGQFPENPKGVFVVQGRDVAANRRVESLLRDLGLEQLTFERIDKVLGTGPHAVWDIVFAGLTMARAVIVLFTAEDQAWLDEKHNPEGEPKRGQARPNVFLEAGLALGMYQHRTILIRHEQAAIPSDLLGHYYVAMTTADGWRDQVTSRLRDIGCQLKESAPRMSAG